MNTSDRLKNGLMYLRLQDNVNEETLVNMIKGEIKYDIKFGIDKELSCTATQVVEKSGRICQYYLEGSCRHGENCRDTVKSHRRIPSKRAPLERLVLLEKAEARKVTAGTATNLGTLPLNVLNPRRTNQRAKARVVGRTNLPRTKVTKLRR